jgi:hypothetical protein
MVLKNFYSSLIILTFFLLAQSLSQQQRPLFNISKQDSSYNLGKAFSYFHFGQRRLISSLTWVKTLMDSDQEHYKKKDLNSWMYLRFQFIADLDPKFLENYQYGGQYLAIVKDDLLGAEKIYRAGLGIYPLDYFLNYHGAFLYFNELGKPDLAIPLLDKVKDDVRAPKFIKPMIISLMTKTNFDNKTINQYIEEMLKDINLSEEMKILLQNKLKN